MTNSVDNTVQCSNILTLADLHPHATLSELCRHRHRPTAQIICDRKRHIGLAWLVSFISLFMIDACTP